HSVFAAPGIDPSPACSVTPDAPDFWLVGYPSSLTVDPAGALAPIALSVVPVGFTGNVNLTVDGLSQIPGVTGSFDQTSINTSGSVNFTLVPSGTTPPGTYPITFIANSGNLTRTTVVALVVPSPTLNLTTTNVNFGTLTVGQTVPAQTVTLTNHSATT